MIKRISYRGISMKEAAQVVARQCYEQTEQKAFQEGVQARSLFGEGLYLTSDPGLAAQYAFCHAEANGGSAAVLKQTIYLHRPIIINFHYTEAHLQFDALHWKYGDSSMPSVPVEQRYAWIGGIVKEYLLAHEYDGIVYHIDEHIIYYVAYFQKKQIKNIEFEFTFSGAASS